MLREKFKPGDRAPASGWYRVVHPSHDHTTEIIVHKDAPFPTCRLCRIAPSYELIGELKSCDTVA